MSEPSQLEAILTKRGFPKAKPLSSEALGKFVDSSVKPLDLIKYEKNLEDLRNTLGQIDSLLAGKQTPEIAAKCASLLGYVAAIDLPAEIKNQEAGRYPPQVQEQVAKTLDSQNKNTDSQAAQSAAYSAAIMQRVSEEAQTRIQKEAALRVEASQLETIKAVREIEERQKKTIEDFLNSECTEEDKRKAVMEIDHSGAELNAQYRENGKALRKNFSNMSSGDQQKRIRDQKLMLAHEREKYAMSMMDERKYKDLAAQSTDPRDKRRYQGLAEIAGAQKKNSLEAVKILGENVAFTENVLNKNGSMMNRGGSGSSVVFPKQKVPDDKRVTANSSDRKQSETANARGKATSFNNSQNKKAIVDALEQQFRDPKSSEKDFGKNPRNIFDANESPNSKQRIPDVEIDSNDDNASKRKTAPLKQIQKENLVKQFDKNHNEQSVIKDSHSSNEVKSLDENAVDTMSFANQGIFNGVNGGQPATKETAPNVPETSSSSMSSTLKQAGWQVKDAPDNSSENSLVNLAMENSTVSGLG